MTLLIIYVFPVQVGPGRFVLWRTGRLRYIREL